MTNKKSLFLCSISLLFLNSYGMDELPKSPPKSPLKSPSKRLPSSPIKSPSKKRPLSNPSEPEPDYKKARTEEPELSFYTELKNHISHFEPVGIYKLQITDKVQQLSEKEKKELLAHAQQLETKTAAICKLGNEIKSHSTKEDLIEKFSFHNEHKAIQKIANHLYAFAVLPKMTFPQVFFTNPPYQPKKYPDLDQILATFIKNEQKELKICWFHVDLPTIKDALIPLKNRVSITMITNQSQEKNAAQIIKFIHTQGITVLAPKNHAFEQMHHKFVLCGCNIFDKPLLITGSYNPTFHGNKNSWDDLNISDDIDMITQYKQRFAELTTRSVPLFS